LRTAFGEKVARNGICVAAHTNSAGILSGILSESRIATDFADYTEELDVG
jgi:hypothetical protein